MGDGQVNGSSDVTDDYVGVGENHVMSFDIADVADLNVNNVILEKTAVKAPNGMPHVVSDLSLLICPQASPRVSVPTPTSRAT